MFIKLIPTALAVDNTVDIGTEVTKNSFFHYTCIWQLISTAASAVLLIAGMASFVFLVWGATEWILSGGDKTKTQEAQGRMTSAIVGLVIVASSWAIYNLILRFLGVDLTNICSTNPIQ